MLLEAQLEALAPRHEVTLVVGVGEEPWEREAARRVSGLASEVRLADRRRPSTLRGRLRRRALLASTWALSRRPWRSVWFAPPTVQALVDECLRRSRFDLVAVEDSAMSALRLPERVPRMLTDHEVRRAQASLLGPRRAVARLLADLDGRRASGFQARAWGRYDLVQVFTEADAQEVRRLAPALSERVRVNPFGIRLPAPSDPLREQEDLLLFVGNFTHPPNREAAAWLVDEIMPRVWEQRRTARLRLVGSAPPPSVRALVGPGVELVADAPSVSAHFAAASVCLAPVRTGGGMRVKVLSALGRGKALVGTSLSAEGYLHRGREAPMMIADDAAGTAAAVLGLLGDPALRRRLGERARAFSEEFHSPAAWGARLDAVYEELAGLRR